MSDAKPLRSEAFFQLSTKITNELVRIAQQDAELARALNPCAYALSPWIFTEFTDDNLKANAVEREKRLTGLGFPGRELVDSMAHLLRNDDHLMKCCGGVFELGILLDRFWIPGLTRSLSLNQAVDLDSLWHQFEEFVYAQGEFKSFLISHLFNFDAERDSFEFPGLKIARLNNTIIGRALGDPNFQPFTCAQGAGDFFVVTEESQNVANYIQWGYQQREIVERFSQVLQYFKDGVVHSDYSVVYFSPDWVNDIRKHGIFFIGKPRLVSYLNASAPYKFSQRDYDELGKWWTVYTDQNISSRLQQKNNFRQALNRAGEYYESSMTREQPTERLIDLAIAVEAMFTVGAGDLTFKISQAVGQLIGTSGQERLSVASIVKDLYSSRSALFHGRDLQVSHEKADIWTSVIRRAYLRLLVLYLRGENNRDHVINRILDSCLDPELAEHLRRTSDVETYLSETNLALDTKI